MNVLDLPYNNFLGIEDAEEDGFLLKLPKSSRYLNHLRTIHAGALFSLAEASSGKFLLNEFADIKFPIIPMLRKATVKYSKAVKGKVASKGRMLNRSKELTITELMEKTRALIDVEVTIYSDKGSKVMTAVFQWFVTKV